MANGKKATKGPSTRYHQKKLKDDANLETLQEWATELHRWAMIITEETRAFEATQQGSQSDHIPDPPPPPFS